MQVGDGHSHRYGSIDGLYSVTQVATLGACHLYFVVLHQRTPLGWGLSPPYGKGQIVLALDAVPPYRGSYWCWLSLTNFDTSRGIA